MSDEVLSVMVVDDEPGIRTALRANFLRHGWNVETASCVREAIRNIDGREFSLVVTDMRMPDGTGMEVMRAARKASPETQPSFLISAVKSMCGSLTPSTERATLYRVRLNSASWSLS